MPVEVGMNTEPAAARDFVQPAAEQGRIRQQPVNPCDGAQKLQELAAMDYIEIALAAGPELGVWPGAALHLVGRIVMDPVSKADTEVIQDLLQKAWLEELVDDDMGKRLCTRELLTQLGGACTRQSAFREDAFNVQFRSKSSRGLEARFI